MLRKCRFVLAALGMSLALCGCGMQRQETAAVSDTHSQETAVTQTSEPGMTSMETDSPEPAVQSPEAISVETASTQTQPGSAGETAASPLTKREQDWISDLETLSQLYKEVHPEPFYYCSEEEFDFRIGQLSAEVGRLSDNDIFFEIAEIVARMGDNHTCVVMPESLYADRFPVAVQYFGEELYLAAYQEGYEQFAPCLFRQIVAVNGVDAAYLTRKLESIFTPMNVWASREVGMRSYFLPAFFNWAGCDYRDGYTFQFLNENNQVEDVEIPVISQEEYIEGVWVTAECVKMIPSLTREGNWVEYFESEEGGYIYMSFCDLAFLSYGPYLNLLKQTKGLIEEHPDCEKLIIDLRYNPGGYGQIADYIANDCTKYLQAPSIRQTYALTGGHTASAGIALLSVFRDKLDAVVVGEPTGQFTSFFHRSIFEAAGTLPNSQIPVYISDDWYEGEEAASAIGIEEKYDEDGKLYEWENTILPDIYISRDIEDVRQGKDSAIQWILEQ